jgi:hypothetical protein
MYKEPSLAGVFCDPPLIAYTAHMPHAVFIGRGLAMAKLNQTIYKTLHHSPAPVD